MRLLFAEDQPQLRRSVTKALTAAGYSVNAAADGAQALTIWTGWTTTPLSWT